MKASEERIGNYDVLEDGTVINITTGRKLRYAINQKGYPCVTLHINGKGHCFRVHRLVAMKYIPNPDNKPIVNHKDRDRANFHVSNLEWTTNQENVRHSVANGGRKNFKRDNKGSKNANSRLAEYHVSAILDLSKLGYSQELLAKIFLVSQSTISKIQNNKLWKLAS